MLRGVGKLLSGGEIQRKRHLVLLKAYNFFKKIFALKTVAMPLCIVTFFSKTLVITLKK